MNSKIYRQNLQCACATCGEEWFGKGGEALARRHAGDTGHQVQIQILHRETINPVAENAEPGYEPLAKPMPGERRASVAAARERVSLFQEAAR